MKKTYLPNDEYLKYRFGRAVAVDAPVGVRVVSKPKRMRVVIHMR